MYQQYTEKRKKKTIEFAFNNFVEFFYLIIFLSLNAMNELIQVLLYVDIKHWQTISDYYSDLNYETQNK